MTDPTSPGAPTVHWQVVIPVKDAGRAKSRLHAPAALLDRAGLARAIALDTIEAACAAVGAPAVTVVTADEGVAAEAAGLGVQVVDDPGAGLNAAVRAGFDHRPATGPGQGRLGWAALLGDLPALRPDDLRTALAACAAQPRAVVPDAAGSGTVLLTSTLSPPEPHFGPGSAAAHARAASVLELDLPRLRRDVDVADDLRAALALGAGRRTRLAIARGA